MFRGTIEEEDDVQDFAMVFKNKLNYLFSELHLVTLMQEKKERLHVRKRTLSIKSKLLEACLKEKDFDPYFCHVLTV